MGIDEMFRPYSPEGKGDLMAYLREHDGFGVDNMFHGPEHFFAIKELGLMEPDVTCLRVAQHPIADIAYFVNRGFMLESHGVGERNMSLVGAEKGVYDPKKALKGRHWSIYYMKHDVLFGPG